MNKTIYVLSWIALGVAAIISFAYLFVGIGLINDQFYWIYLFKDYKSNPMTIGTLWLGNVWGRVISDSLISYRILKWLIELLSLYIACNIGGFHKKRCTIWLYAVALLLIGYGWQNEFSPTVVTNFFIVLTAVSFSKYTNNYSLRVAIIMGVIIGISAVMRFPNIVALPIVAFLMILLGMANGSGAKKVICHVCVCCVIAMLAWWIIMALLLQNVNPIDSVFGNVSSAAQGTHGISSLLNGYMWDFSSYFGLITSACFFGLSLLIVRGNMPKNWKFVVGFLGFFLFSLFYVKTIGFHKWHNFQLISFLSASILVILLVGMVQSLTKKHYVDSILLFSIALLCFVSTAGSDTRYLKLFPVTLFFLPYLWQQVVEFKKTDLYVYPVFATIVFCSVICFWINPDASSDKPVPVWKRTESVLEKSLSFIKVSKEEANWVSSITSAIENFSGTKKTFGFASFFLNYVSHGEIQVGCKKFGDSYMNDNSFVEEQISQIQDGDVVIVCSMKTTLFEQTLIGNGFQLQEKNDLFKVYCH